MAPSPNSKKRTLSGEEGQAAFTVSSSSTNKRLKQDSARSPGGQNVRVVARVRPLSKKEVNECSKEVIGVVPSLDRSTTISINAAIGSRGGSNNSPKSFEYDGAFGPSTSQEELYEHTVGDLVRHNIFSGFNATVMAYGQTGSGKVSCV